MSDQPVNDGSQHEDGAVSAAPAPAAEPVPAPPPSVDGPPEVEVEATPSEASPELDRPEVESRPLPESAEARQTPDPRPASTETVEGSETAGPPANQGDGRPGVASGDEHPASLTSDGQRPAAPEPPDVPSSSVPGTVTGRPAGGAAQPGTDAAQPGVLSPSQPEVTPQAGRQGTPDQPASTTMAFDSGSPSLGAPPAIQGAASQPAEREVGAPPPDSEDITEVSAVAVDHTDPTWGPVSAPTGPQAPEGPAPHSETADLSDVTVAAGGLPATGGQVSDGLLVLDTEEILALTRTMTAAARELQRIVAQLAGARGEAVLSTAMQSVTEEIGRGVARTLEAVSDELEEESAHLSQRVRAVGS